MNTLRDQKFYVIQRKKDLQFWVSSVFWSPKISRAHIVSKKKAKGFIRCEIGLNMEDVNVLESVPALPENDAYEKT